MSIIKSVPLKSYSSMKNFFRKIRITVCIKSEVIPLNPEDIEVKILIHTTFFLSYQNIFL
jgi:hypothetical protein